jgi:hypothetical protein
MAMSFASGLSRSAHLQMRALLRVAPEMLVKQFTAAGELRGLPPLGSVEIGVVAVGRAYLFAPTIEECIAADDGAPEPALNSQPLYPADEKFCARCAPGHTASVGH